MHAREALEDARATIAAELACKAREIIFTSGLSESLNLAILGTARARDIAGTFANTHWIVSSIEHSAVLESFAEIERLGGAVTYIDPDARGLFSPDIALRALRPNTVFLSIGWANNEVGVLQPIREIAQALRELRSNDGPTKSIMLHADAGQAPLYVVPHVNTLGVDLLSLGSNKLYGPHGIGALYVGKNASIAPIILGGGQERGFRSGTENVALAVGFASAVHAIARERHEEERRLRALRDTFARTILEQIPTAVVNGTLDRGLPHLLNISIPDIQSEYITLALDRVGIALSTKSACNEGIEGKSHVLEAMYATEKGAESREWRSANTLRFSLGRETTAHELEQVVLELARIVERATRRD